MGRLRSGNGSHRRKNLQIPERVYRRNGPAFSRPVLSYWRRRSERQGVGRQSEDPGVHEGASHQEQRGAAGLLQRPRAGPGDEAQKDAGGLGRSTGARRAENDRDSIVARRGFTGRRCEDGIPGDTFERLLPGPRMERRALLRDGSAWWSCNSANTRAEATDSWRRIDRKSVV